MATIEIEKKFLPTPEQQEALLKDAKIIESKVVTDTYLDTPTYELSTHDLWLRERDGVYELKAPPKAGSGSYSGTNRYHEITDPRLILQELGLDPNDTIDTAFNKADIAPFMICYTNRSSYEKDGFHIDVDSATYDDSEFTYALVEIELLVDETEAEEADSRIMEFARQYNLRADGVILGKIAALLKEERPEHYNALVAANILK
jgi:adenylate cyclase class IV